MSDEFRTYGIDYTYRGSRWAMTVMATSEADALNRLRAAAERGVVVGSLVASGPIVPGLGWVPRFACAIRNWWAGR